MVISANVKLAFRNMNTSEPYIIHVLKRQYDFDKMEKKIIYLYDLIGNITAIVGIENKLHGEKMQGVIYLIS